MTASATVGFAEAPIDLALPSAARIGLLLVGGFGAVALAERRHWKDLQHRGLFLQWRTWLLIAPIYVAAVTLSSWTTVVLAAILGVQAALEYAALVSLPSRYRTALVLPVVGGLLAVAVEPRVWPALVPLLTVSPTVVPLVTADTGDGVRHLAFTVLGCVLIAWPFASLISIRNDLVGGPGILLAIGTSLALSDVLAFGVGSRAGRTRLAPRLSPGKTYAGLAGNVVGAFAGFSLMSFALPPWLPGSARWVLPLLVAAGSVWGDLTESLLKRHRGVKDAGHVLPGFGGLLDRVDSLLFVLPLSRLALEVMR